MKVKTYLRGMALTMPVAFVVATVVTFAYNLIAHGAGQVNWETVFQLTIILGLVLPLNRAITD